MVESWGEACGANGGRGCRRRSVEEVLEGGQGFGSGRCRGKTCGGHGGDVLRGAERSEVCWS